MKAIRNHIFLAVGSLRKIPGYSHQRSTRTEGDEQPPYSITNVLEMPRKPVCDVSNEISDNNKRYSLELDFA